MPSFVAGTSFLTPKEEERFKELEKNYLLLKTKFDLIKFVTPEDKTKEEFEKWIKIVAKLPETISKVSADLLMGETPIIEGDTDKTTTTINEEIYNNKFKLRLHAGTMVQSSLGGILIKVVSDENNNSGLSFVSPKNFIPELEIDESSVMKRAHLFYKFDGRVNGQTEKILFVETHEPGKIFSRVYLLESSNHNKIRVQLPLADFFPNREDEGTIDLDEIPLYYIPNFLPDLGFHGESDYHGLDGFFHAINRRLTQNEASLDRFGEPKMTVPPGILDWTGKPVKRSWNYLEMPNNMGEKMHDPKFLQQQLSTDDNLETIKSYIMTVFFLSEQTPAYFGFGEGSLPESGTALRTKLLRTLTMVRRKSSHWQFSLAMAINAALKLRGKGEVKSITMQDGLPTDTNELIQQQQDRIDGGTQTTSEAIELIDGVSEADAKAKTKEISIDQQRRRNSTGGLA